MPPQRNEINKRFQACRKKIILEKKVNKILKNDRLCAINGLTFKKESLQKNAEDETWRSFGPRHEYSIHVPHADSSGSEQPPNSTTYTR